MTAKTTQPIIVIKKKGGHGGHHGGAWKVAYADFVTAMMSLFIVLWLMGSSEKVKKAVAGYFNDPKGTASLLGTTMAGNGVAVTIQDKNGVFYQSGSAKLSESGQELLTLLATELKTLPNELLIEGHTDATQYSTDNNYSNWELSADRANSARRLLQTSGVRADQVTQVRGYADQMLRVKSNPYDPSNRRISMLVKNNVNGAAPPTMKGSEVVGNPMPPAAAKDKESAAKPPSATPAAEAAPLAPPHPQVAAKPLAGTSAATPVPAAKPALAKPGILDKLKSMLPVGKK